MLPRFEDLVLIYAVLTPTSVLYWHTTAVLLDQLVGHNAVKMVLGFASAVAFAYYHEVFSNNAPTSSSRLVLTSYETAFDYMVKLSCLCYHLGCRTIYDLLLATGLLAPVHIAVLAAAFLIHLRGFRNVLALPLVVNNDDSVERYRPLSSLTFSSGRLRAK